MNDIEARNEIEDPFHPKDRVVIPRDYTSNPLFTRFDEAFYAPQLEKHKISREDLKKTIRTINEFFVEAESLNCTTFMEGCIGCLTFFSLFLCYENNYKKVLRRLDSYLSTENDRLYRKNGLEILNPLANGLLEIEIKIVTSDPSDMIV